MGYFHIASLATGNLGCDRPKTFQNSAFAGDADAHAALGPRCLRIEVELPVDRAVRVEPREFDPSAQPAFCVGVVENTVAEQPRGNRERL